MGTKTISLKLEAYDRLVAARRTSGESFSQVVMRAQWPQETITAAGLLEMLRERGALLTPEELDRVEQLKHADHPPEDKWRSH
jgi:predicted CopG family antitoxin